MEKPSQATAVRNALTELGLEADNKTIVDWIKEKYDIDVSANISQVKSKIKKSMVQSLPSTTYKPMTYVPEPSPPPMPQHVPQPTPSTNGQSQPVSLGDVKTMATLLKRYGKSGIDDIIELLDEVAD